MRTLPRRQRLFIGLAARIALLALALQISALDHHLGIAGVVGIEGTSAHTMHCHGDTAGCADAGSGAIASVDVASVLPLQAARALKVEIAVQKPRGFVSLVEAEPPRL